jgi:tetratricopeptide (TPR) repeat protein
MRSPAEPIGAVSPAAWLRLLSLLLLAVATAGVFAGVLGNGWIQLDDPMYVLQDSHVSRGLTLAGARWFLHEPHGGNWHPLTSYSHMLDVQLYGFEPAGHHATSLVLHVLNALLLALVLFRLTGAWWRSVLVAACFALHPLRVESVAWVAERKDVLSTFFFLLALDAYRRWVARPAPARYVLLLVAFVLGLMSKPMVVTLPFVLLLLDLWPLRRLAGLDGRPDATRRFARSLGARTAEKWPLFVLAAASALVTYGVQKKTGAVAPVDLGDLGTRACNALVSCWRYVGKTLWPVNLAVIYPIGHRPDAALTAAAAAGLLAVTLAALWQVPRRPYLAVGWLWYLGMLIPVIGLIQVGVQAYADRYTYIPVMGLVVAMVWGAGDLVAGRRSTRIPAAVAAGLALVALATATSRQVALWKDTRTLFAHTLAVTRDNGIAQSCFGTALAQSGQPRLALPHFQEALRLMPGYAVSRNNLGSVLTLLGRYEEAAAQFRASLRMQETAMIHANLGEALGKLGRSDEALAEYEAALRLDPDDRRALLESGAALAARGRLAESETRLRRLLELQPADDAVRKHLAGILARENRVDDALGQYREILRRSPADWVALEDAAWIRATHPDPGHRDGAEAVRLAERARDGGRTPPVVMYRTLAAAYAEAGRFPEAVRAGERAVALARSARDSSSVAGCEQQLARYRAGQPFHYAK